MSEQVSVYDRRYRYLSGVLFKINDSMRRYEEYNACDVRSKFSYFKNYTSELDLICGEILSLMGVLAEYDLKYEIFMYKEFENLYFLAEDTLTRNIRGRCESD